MTAENEGSEGADNTWDETFMSKFQPNSSEACASSEDECEQVTLEQSAKRVKTCNRSKTFLLISKMQVIVGQP